MSEDKTKFVRCGDTTSKTRKAWSSSWIVTIATVFPRREMNFTACSTKTNSATRCCWSLRTSKICRTRWLRLKLRTNSDYTRWDKDTGSFNLRARLRAKACTKVWTGFRRTLQTTNRKTERVGKEREWERERERERKWGVENERKRVGEIERERKPSYQNLKRKKAVFSNNKILIVCLEGEKERKRECRVRNEEERNISNQSAKHSRREYTTRTTMKPRRAASPNKVVCAHRSFSHIYKN